MKMEKNKLVHESLESSLLTRLTDLVNDDGDFIYPGDGDEISRTGSNLNALLKYVLNNIGSKPIDTHIFVSFLHDTMHVPQHLLNHKPPKWNKLN